jgi:hypothetical protein
MSKTSEVGMTRGRWAGRVFLLSWLAPIVVASCGGDEFQSSATASAADAGTDVSQPEGSAGKPGAGGAAGTSGAGGAAGTSGAGGAAGTSGAGGAAGTSGAGGKGGDAGAGGASHTHIPVTLKQGTNNYYGSQTAWLNAWDPAGAQVCPNKEFRVGYDNKYRALLKFSLATPQVPSSANVNQATLRLYSIGWAGVCDAGVCDHVKIQVYGLSRPTDLCNANWNQAASAVPWATPGCDGAGDRSTMMVTEVLVDQISQWYDFDVTALVRAWQLDPSTNFGMILLPVEAYGMLIFSGDAADISIANRRPELYLDLEI